MAPVSFVVMSHLFFDPGLFLDFSILGFGTEELIAIRRKWKSPQFPESMTHAMSSNDETPG
jgi:hypothetical protein